MFCTCHQPPRLLFNGYAICRCTHLVHQPVASFAPPSFAPATIGTPSSTWQAVVNPQLRRQLIHLAKSRIGIDMPVFDPADVMDAVIAARIAGDHALARDLEYEQWVAAL